MVLRDKDLKERILTDPKKIKDAYNLWKKSKWDKIGDNILIDPFEPEEKLSLVSYDLSVGEEYVSLRDPYNIKKIKEGEAVSIDPSETVLILTNEYVALPKNVMAMIVPRARWIFEGAFLNASRIDPTWYGKILVGFTNVTKWTMSLGFKKPFCTCYFMECNNVGEHLTKKVVPFLGRTTIDPLTFSFARPRELLKPQQFTKEHLDTVVSSFGYPWDIVQCAIERGKMETIEYIERDVAPRIVEEATLKVTERAYKDLLDLQKAHQKTLTFLTKALLGFVITVAVGVVSALILAVLRFLGII